MEIKLRIRLKNKITGEILTMYNSVFDAMNGIAWFEIDRKLFELLSFDQYIGINDANNKEIYVNDIIKHPNATEPEDFGWLIEYEDFSFKKKCVRLVNGEVLKTSISKFYVPKCEVIGNVYDNHKLLSA